MSISYKKLIIFFITFFLLPLLSFAVGEDPSYRTGKETFKEIKAYIEDDSKVSIYVYDESGNKVDFFTTHVEGVEYWGDVYIIYDLPAFEEGGFYFGVDEYSENIEVYMYDHQAQEITIFRIQMLDRGEKIILNTNREIQLNDTDNQLVNTFLPDTIEPKEFKQVVRSVTAAANLSDINGDEWFYKGLELLYNKKVISGYPDGTFKPDKEINRAELLKIATLFPLNIIEIKSYELENKIESAFKDYSDVPLSEWFYDYIQSASEKGIVQGYPDGTFKPGQSTNRVEALKMLILAMNIDIPEKCTNSIRFTDLNIDEWYAPFVCFADENGVLERQSESLFLPRKPITRAEVVDWAGKILDLD